MSISVAPVGAPRHAEGVDPSKMAAKIASKMMRDLDTNKDASLDKNEFVTGLSAKGVPANAAEKMFDTIDTKKTGSINTADLESAVKSGAIKPPPRRSSTRRSQWPACGRWRRVFAKLRPGGHQQRWIGVCTGGHAVQHEAPVQHEQPKNRPGKIGEQRRPDRLIRGIQRESWYILTKRKARKRTGH